MTRRQITGRIVLGLTLATVLSGIAGAEAMVYHSAADDGSVPAVVPTLPSSGPEWIHLYVDADGTAVTITGSPCQDGDGDELCGFQVSLRAGAGTEILDFVPAGAVYHTLAGGTLHANAIDPIAPDTAAMKVGDLLVQSTSPATGGTIDATGHVVITAGLDSHIVVEGPIAMVPAPEPGVVAGLLSGIGSLAFLHRRSVRRRARGGHNPGHSVARPARLEPATFRSATAPASPMPA
jgi:hypothetical protein